MPTLSFPLTIRVSIDVPEFLAPQAAASVDAGAWQFKADYVDGPGPVESTEEIIAEIHRRIGLTEPQVVTESEYTPAPKVGGKSRGQSSTLRDEPSVRRPEAAHGSKAGSDSNEKSEVGGEKAEVGGQWSDVGGKKASSDSDERSEDEGPWSKPRIVYGLNGPVELPALPPGHPWRRPKQAAGEPQGAGTGFQSAAARPQPAASHTQPTASYEERTASYEQPAERYEEPVAEPARSAAEPNQPADPPPQEKATRPKIVGDIKHPTETTLEGEEITPAQQTAILLMLRGASIAKAALAIGVHPNTVHRWKREDARFRAVWNAQRNDYHDAARAKMEFLGNQVAYVLSEEISKGNFRAALQVAKGLGLLTGKPPEPAEESAEQIEQVDRAQALAREAQTEAKHWLESLPARKRKIKFWKNKEQCRALYAERIRKRLDKLTVIVKEWHEAQLESNTVVAEGSGI